MLIIKIKIKDEQIKEICETMEEFFGLTMTQHFVTQFLRKHSDLAVEISNAGFDTACREIFVDEIAYGLIGRCWPAYGESAADKKKFTIAFCKAAAKIKSIKLEEDWVCSTERLP